MAPTARVALRGRLGRAATSSRSLRSRLFTAAARPPPSRAQNPARWGAWPSTKKPNAAQGTNEPTPFGADAEADTEEEEEDADADTDADDEVGLYKLHAVAP